MLQSIGIFLSGGVTLLLYMVIFPAVCGFLLWLLKKQLIFQTVTAILSSAACIVFSLALLMYPRGEFSAVIPYAPYGFEYSFRVYGLSSFFLVFTSAVFLLLVIYTAAQNKNEGRSGLHLFYLFLSYALVNGALLSDSLGLMMLFWEGLLAVLFCMLLSGGKTNPKTLFKAMAVQGLAVLLLMLGIIITAHTAGTSTMSQMKNLPIRGESVFGFILLMLGALGKSGSMPFHSWTLNASEEAPAAFMAAIPGALEKILGIYFAARIVLDIYDFTPGSSMSIAMMTLGVTTIILSAAMALVQKDMKRLIAYCAVGFSGYSILGIGTGLMDGLVGGLFFLMNTVFCISGLYMISGAVERKTKTTDISHLGGLFRTMKVETVCFILLALSAAGFPGFLGFFAGQLIFDAAADTNVIFLIGAGTGLFMTALALLNMGRLVFFGKEKMQPQTKEDDGQKEEDGQKVIMRIPVTILSFCCILSGAVFFLAGNGLSGVSSKIVRNFSGWPQSFTSATPSAVIIAILSAAVLFLAVCAHLYLMKGPGSKGNAEANPSEMIRGARGLRRIYQSAEEGRFDPYNWMMAAVGALSEVCTGIEHGVSWVYDTAVPALVKKTGAVLSRFDNGSLPRYLLLVVFGIAVIIVIFVSANI